MSDVADLLDSIHEKAHLARSKLREKKNSPPPPPSEATYLSGWLAPRHIVYKSSDEEGPKAETTTKLIEEEDAY